MTELRYIADALNERDGCQDPKADAAMRETARLKLEAEKDFNEWLKTIPEPLRYEVEDKTAEQGCRWMDDGFERGFIAGARMMVQIMTGRA